MHEEMAGATEEKLDFLLRFVPTMRRLQPKVAEGCLYLFTRMSIPKGHIFIEQGVPTNGAIYLILQGAVEPYTRAAEKEGLLPDAHFRRLPWLLTGGVFGALPANQRLPFTMVAQSYPCEVLVVSADNFKQLPELVMRGLRDLGESGK